MIACLMLALLRMKKKRRSFRCSASSSLSSSALTSRRHVVTHPPPSPSIRMGYVSSRQRPLSSDDATTANKVAILIFREVWTPVRQKEDGEGQPSWANLDRLLPPPATSSPAIASCCWWRRCSLMESEKGEAQLERPPATACVALRRLLLERHSHASVSI